MFAKINHNVFWKRMSFPNGITLNQYKRMKVTQIELILTHFFDKTHLLILSWFCSIKWFKMRHSNMNYLSKLNPHKKKIIYKSTLKEVLVYRTCNQICLLHSLITATRPSRVSNQFSYSQQRIWNRVRSPFDHGDTSETGTAENL